MWQAFSEFVNSFFDLIGFEDMRGCMKCILPEPIMMRNTALISLLCVSLAIVRDPVWLFGVFVSLILYSGFIRYFTEDDTLTDAERFMMYKRFFNELMIFLGLGVTAAVIVRTISISFGLPPEVVITTAFIPTLAVALSYMGTIFQSWSELPYPLPSPRI